MHNKVAQVLVQTLIMNFGNHTGKITKMAFLKSTQRQHGQWTKTQTQGLFDNYLVNKDRIKYVDLYYNC